MLALEGNQVNSELSSVLEKSPLVKHWVHLDTIDSTQRLGLDLAQTERAGLVVVADCQKQGRGRMGRSWFSPTGSGLWLSLVIDVGRPEAEWPVLTTLAALAVREALAEVAGLKSQFKWPNDLVVPVAQSERNPDEGDDQGKSCSFGRKIAGILADVAPRSRLVVLGIGINISQSGDEFPPELRDDATSIYRESGVASDRSLVLRNLLNALESRLALFRQNGLSALHDEIKTVMPAVGSFVTIKLEAEGELPPRITSGRVIDIGLSGELILTDSAPGQGEQIVVSSGRIQRVDPPLAEEI